MTDEIEIFLLHDSPTVNQHLFKKPLELEESFCFDVLEEIVSMILPQGAFDDGSLIWLRVETTSSIGGNQGKG